MATAYASIELAVDAMKLGATDFAQKPMTPEALRNAVARFHSVSADHVVLGCGSADVLRMAAHAFTSAARPLVAAPVRVRAVELGRRAGELEGQVRRRIAGGPARLRGDGEEVPGEAGAAETTASA